jgi:sialate O-acetylesterase
MATAAAGPVYRLLGRRDLGTSTFPPMETALVAGDLAFRQHSGGHTNGPNWPAFLSFADRYFSGRPLLSSLFHDHAVLQRDRPVRVWGWAAPGETVDVSVSLAGSGKSTDAPLAALARATARADATGRWLATLPPMKAGGPHVLTVRSASGATAAARDILVGDVWLCSGQSNMALQVHRTLDARAEIARSANDSIRMITLDLVNNSTPLADVARIARWQAASPATTPEFSATCFYFARELQKTVKVPMGLITSAWGGSRIEAWMSAESLRKVGGYDDALDLLSLQAKDPSAAIGRWSEMWQTWWRAHAAGRGVAEPWAASAEITGYWKTVPDASKPWEEWGVPALAEYNGIVWYRTSFTLDQSQASQAATLAFGPVDEVDTTWVNGKAAGYTSGAGTPRSYSLAPGTLHAGENSIAIAALDTYATGGMLGATSQRTITLANGTVIPLTGEWKYEVAPTGIGPVPRAPWESTGGVTTIYNAMAAPLTPYTLRGVAWYQGESNTEMAARYEKLLAAWMADWRKQFDAPELPFLIVQLANYGGPPTHPAESDWAQLREAQRAAVANDKHAGLAVTIDIGDRYDIHPTNKQEVGRRLARAARRVVYGENIAPSGPVAKNARLVGKNVVVEFDDVQGKLHTLSSQNAVGFELCGPPTGATSGSCEYAAGTPEENRVIIKVPEGSSPTRVRYCWADSPVCTLFDDANLPAGPFEVAIR